MDLSKLFANSYCVNLTHQAANTSINFVDNVNNHFYRIDNNDYIRTIFTAITRSNDGKNSLLNSPRFCERTYDKQCGMTIIFNDVQVGDLLSLIQTLIVDQGMKRYCSYPIDVFVYENVLMMPNFRASYQMRCTFVKHLAALLSQGSSSLASVRLTTEHPLVLPTQHFIMRANSFGILRIDEQPKPVVGADILVRLSTILSHAEDMYFECSEPIDEVAMNKNFVADVYTTSIDKIRATPEIDFAYQLIEYIADHDWELFKSQFEDILYALKPKGDCFFYKIRHSKLDNEYYPRLIEYLIFAYTSEIKMEGKIMRKGDIAEYRKRVLDGPHSEKKNYTIIDLIYWVTNIMPSINEYDMMVHRLVINKLYTLAINSFTSLQEDDISRLIYYKYCHKFASQEVANMAGTAIYKWYHFNEEEESENQYKWKPINGFGNVIFDAANDLKDLINTCLQDLSSKLRDNDTMRYTSEQLKHIYKRLEGVIMLVKKLTNISPQISFNLNHMFLRTSFFNMLDQDPYVIGVRNGVLLLANGSDRLEPQLIRTYHSYAISRTTNAAVLDYDDERVIEWRQRWYDYVFDDEAALWLLMFWAQALDNCTHAAVMLFMIAEGSRAKSFWTELTSEALNQNDSVLPRGYSTKGISNLFAVNSHENANNHTSGLAKLPDIHFTVAPEAESGAFSTNMMKRLLSQERQATRQIYKAETVSMINIVLTYVSNHNPRFDRVDWGSRRRMRAFSPRFKYLTDPNPNNPEERLEDPRFNKNYKTDVNVMSAWFTVLLEVHTLLQNKYRGDLERVPVPKRIQDDTNNMLKDADPLTQFATIRLSRVDGADPISLDVMQDEYRQFTDIHYRGRKMVFNESLTTMFGDSILSKHFDRETRIFSGLVLIDHENEQDEAVRAGRFSVFDAFKI